VRKPLEPYRGVNALNYLCLLATDLLGISTLRGIPTLLSGFESVLNTLPPAAARAIRNLRLSGYSPTTLRELRLMVDGYTRYHERRERERRKSNVSAQQKTQQEKDDEFLEDGLDQRFLISHDFSFQKRWRQIVPEDVRQALQSLTMRLPPRETPQVKFHDGTREAEIQQKSSGFEAHVQALDFVPPSPPRYDTVRRPRVIAPIQWNDLVAIANRFDDIDRQTGRQNVGERTWYGRLYDAHGERKAILYSSEASGLATTDVLHLAGIRHLIGLPGSGKTTLLYLLAAYLHERGYRACFLFPSIEVSTGFLETLKRYEIQAALLFGQSTTTRNRHVANFGSTLASQNKGLGVTRSVAPFFATNCALAAYASDEEEQFPHTDPPCRAIEQEGADGGRRRTRLCALASACGRQYSERTLAEAPIWVGHVLSMDRRISPLFGDLQINHFELIARTCDLLVVDECDNTQSTLDERGTPLMKLSGDDSSVWSRLIEDLHGPAARGRNAFVSRQNMPSMLEMTGRFGRAAERLTARVMHVREPFRKTHERMLLTTISIIADMFDEQDELGPRNALERIWDFAAKLVAFRSTKVKDRDDAELEPDDPTDLERTLDEAAQFAGSDIPTMRAFYEQLQDALELWDRDGDDLALTAVTLALKQAPGLKTVCDDATFFEYAGLLTTVSLLVLQHFGLAPHLRMLNAQGLVGDDVFEQRPSRDALAILPETLVGRLSGVRYTLNDEGDIDISHVGFVGTPRLLTQRMHLLGMEDGEGPAVLLTSATSLLAASPSFHVNAGPHYVLNRPHAGKGWADSKYRFLPQRDPRDEHLHLRFSGARMSQRERVLKDMVDQLFRGGAMSEIESALQSNDVVESVGRKVGFVLNSYDQCRLLFDHIISFHPAWRGRVRYLIRGGSHGPVPEGALTASEIENLGRDPTWDLLLFPMNAIGRGVNIVYRFGPRMDKAMLGSLYFLTRPHPRSDSLLLLQGIIGRESERFDSRRFASTTEALDGLRQARKEASRVIERLLRLPLSSQRLAEYAEPFVADQMIMILQTIGRAMRGDCPAFVYFVDQAWAPQSATGQRDDRRSSMLVMMRSILNECLNHPDPAQRECYQNLYTSFAEPLNNMEGLYTS
jgi:hypothetical protein